VIIKKRKVLERLKTLAWDNLSRESRCFHIAFIFKGNNILSIGVNSKKTHPQIKKYGYQDFSRLHAELAAAIKFGKTDCRKYSLAVLRIDRNGEFNQSKPCECCSNMLNQLNFKNVYFTNSEGEWESN
jgi:deoxycytidylate deaminase